MNTQSTQATDNNQSDAETLGAYSVGNVLIKLYEYAAPHLSDAELEFMSMSITNAKTESDNMARITENLGCLIANDSEGEFDGTMPALLFQISSHMGLVSGLSFIGEEAKFRLHNPDKAFPLRTEAIA